MSNRILDVLVEDHSLDPMSAEVWITVRPQSLTPATELRGRLMGPNCPYAATVEIAYPLSPLKRPEQQSAGALRCRVVIPEPSMWDMQSPFLYSGPVELWQDGQLTERVVVRHGLRQLRLGPQGLRLNGKPLTLSGRLVDGLTEADALELRRAGCNLLVMCNGGDEVWDVADRFGFLIVADHPRPEHVSWVRGVSVEGERVLYGDVEIGKVRSAPGSP